MKDKGKDKGEEKGNRKGKHPNNSEPTGISRRKFLKGVGVGGSVLGTGILTGELLPEGQAAARQASTPKLYGPAAAPIELTVNGQQKSLRVEPRVTLLEALRENLDLTGAKKVCDRATCGACSVILDGSLVYSCSVFAIEANGRSVQTVEGLAGSGGLHPVQAAFVENDAQQCGFCTSGFVMAVKVLLDKHPNPSPEEMRMALGGNLCRCGTYVGMHKAVTQAAAEMRNHGNRQSHLAPRGGING